VVGQPRKCVALLSGGLDSILAIRLMQQQGVAVEAVHFQTPFITSYNRAAAAANSLGAPLTVLPQDDDYLRLLEKPRFGYGKGANPCIDCRIYMFEKSRQFMDDCGAHFIVSGEVAGQRPSCQKRNDLPVISHHSGLKDLLLRPLSAKLLPPVLAEREGWVDRQQLYDFSGNGRKGQIRLARQLGLEEIPHVTSGCALIEPAFAKKAFDLIQIGEATQAWDYRLLSTGRHFRFSQRQKVIAGRNQADTTTLQAAYAAAGSTVSALLAPANFRGPAAVITGPLNEQVLAFACGIVRRFSKTNGPEPMVTITTANGVSRLAAAEHALAVAARSIASN